MYKSYLFIRGGKCFQIWQLLPSLKKVHRGLPTIWNLLNKWETNKCLESKAGNTSTLSKYFEHAHSKSKNQPKTLGKSFPAQHSAGVEAERPMAHQTHQPTHYWNPPRSHQHWWIYGWATEPQPAQEREMHNVINPYFHLTLSAAWRRPLPPLRAREDEFRFLKNAHPCTLRLVLDVKPQTP